MFACNDHDHHASRTLIIVSSFHCLTFIITDSTRTTCTVLLTEAGRLFVDEDSCPSESVEGNYKRIAIHIINE